MSSNDSNFLKRTEESDLPDSFWDATLIQNLNTSGTGNPYFNAFLAAQIKSHDEGFVSPNFSVNDLVNIRGDIHHISPMFIDEHKYVSNNVYLPFIVLI